MKTTVIIPTYNRAVLMQRAIQSVLNQTIQPTEIIIVDDGSIDNTKDIILHMNISHLRYLYQNNLGVSSARNLGIQNSLGDFIFFLDSDDTWEDTKIEKQLAFHNKNPDILCSHTNERWIYNNKIIKQSKKHKKPSGFCFEENLNICKIGASCLCIHKSIFEEIGLFSTRLQICEDYELYLRLLNIYEIGLLEENLTTKYAGHEQLSFSTNNIDTHRLKALNILLDYNLKPQYKKLVQEQISIKQNFYTQ